MQPRYRLISLGVLALTLVSSVAASAPGPVWQHLSSHSGELPAPNGGQQQSVAVVFDVDGDSVNDIVLGERTAAPGLIWLRRTATGWDKHFIDDGPRRSEAGGFAFDVDNDGDPDFVVGGDYKSNEVWWFENPRPHFDPQTPWKRHLIKQSGLNAHHDQAMADFLGTGRAQLMFWNQRAKKLFLAERPADPRTSGPWPITEIFDYSYLQPAAPTPGLHPAIAKAKIKQEGMDICDIDGDGKPDLLAGQFWFKHTGGTAFKAIAFADHPGRVAAGWFKRGKHPQIVLAPGDGSGPLMIYECVGDPTDSQAWRGRDLLGTTVIHGHSLALGDVDGDGNLDILTAEMGQWDDNPDAPPDNPDARAWILYGDGAGNFTPTVLSTGIGFHEARLADLNGDGRLDVLNKPYRWMTPRLEIWLNQGNAPSGAAAPAPASAATPSADIAGRHRPVLDGPWKTIVEYPGLYLNDFTVFRAPDRRWHAIGILGDERRITGVSFFHSSGADFNALFENHPPLLTDVPTDPKLAPQKHAPHVVQRDGVLHMFYRRPGGTIMHVRGRDPFTWDGLGTKVFSERDARDQCVVWDGARYVMYYCQSKAVDGVLRSCILARTSPDLETWSDASTVYVDTAVEAKHSKLENPFVVRRDEGWYLFVSNRRIYRPADNPASPPPVTVLTVLFSKDPLNFGRGLRPWFHEISTAHDGAVNPHAPEIVEADGRLWMVCVDRVRIPGRPGVTGRLEIAPLRWVPAP